MNIRQWLAFALIAALAGVNFNAAAADPGADGLVKVSSKHFDEVYLRPDTDFGRYTKVMLLPWQVAFATNWLRDMNTNKIAVLQGTSPKDAESIAQAMGAGLEKSFARAFQNSGYEIATTPAPDVLSVSVRLTDVYVNAPDSVTLALPSRVYTASAGRATLSVEIGDSASGTVLGRIVDRRIAGERGSSFPNSFMFTSPASNRFNFGRMFDDWSQSCVATLKTPTPVAVTSPAQAH